MKRRCVSTRYERVLGRFIWPLLFLAFGANASFARQGWLRGLDLEPALADATLVLVARVAEVSETKVVLGGKVEQSIEQIKFEPVSVLKGVFSRESLSLTSNDLGFNRYGDGWPEIERGQFRLLILARTGRGYGLRFGTSSFDQSVPPLRGADDPLLEAVRVLLAVSAAHDRAKKVELLLDGLQVRGGPGAIPLLSGLERRALLAAQTPGAVTALARHMTDPLPSVREAAAKALRALLEADYLGQRALRENAVGALGAALERSEADVAARVAAWEALGFAGDEAVNRGLVLAQLRLAPPGATFAEQAARLRAIGRLRIAAQRDAAADFLDHLPIDAPDHVQEAAGWALARLDATLASQRLAHRLKRKFASGMSVETEIRPLGELPAALAVPALLEAFKLPLDGLERIAFARACKKVPDSRLVPALAELLHPRRPELRWYAVKALRKIDTPEAARALQPHLGEESDLLRKLEIAEFLGRHGIRSGYPYAIEHMAEPYLLEQAVAALAAIREPKAPAELREIFKTSNDLAWNTSAVRALGRLGETELARRFLEIAQDFRDPLAAPALIALGDLKEPKALAKVREGLASRKPALVAASARAAGSLLALPEIKADDIRDQLGALLADSEAPEEARAAAFVSLAALNDSRLPAALGAAVRDGGLEGTKLLVEKIERSLRDRKVKLSFGRQESVAAGGQVVATVSALSRRGL